MSQQVTQPENEILQGSNFCQIGIVVKSVTETVKYFKEVFGFGPFEIRDVSYPTATYYGKTAGYRGKRGFFNLGPIQIELIELVDVGNTFTGRSLLSCFDGHTLTDPGIRPDAHHGYNENRQGRHRNNGHHKAQPLTDKKTFNDSIDQAGRRHKS